MISNDELADWITDQWLRDGCEARRSMNLVRLTETHLKKLLHACEESTFVLEHSPLRLIVEQLWERDFNDRIAVIYEAEQRYERQKSTGREPHRIGPRTDL